MSLIISYLENLKPEIDAAIEKYVPRKASQQWLEFVFGKSRYQYALGAVQESLLDPVWDFLDRGGKRWRPALFLLVAEAVGGDPERLKDFSIIPELIHNGSLVVDDVEDRGELRRGKPCLHKLFGIDTALNAGNFMYFIPLIVFRESSLDSETLLKAYNVYAQEMMNIHLGQGTDIFWHKGKADKISQEQYFQMCIFKTGCLARMSARLAVVLSGKSRELASKIGRVAESIGVAFQIQDDVLDVALKGREREEFGKSFGNDIKEGKRSLMAIHALNNAGPGDRSRLLGILNRHTEDAAEIKEAIAIMEKYGSIEHARTTAKSIIEDAWQEVDGLLEESDAKDMLKNFAHYLVERSV